jgi:hypothetical protein
MDGSGTYQTVVFFTGTGITQTVYRCVQIEMMNCCLELKDRELTQATQLASLFCGSESLSPGIPGTYLLLCLAIGLSRRPPMGLSQIRSPGVLVIMMQMWRVLLASGGTVSTMTYDFQAWLRHILLKISTMVTSRQQNLATV